VSKDVPDVQFSLKIRILHLGAFRWTNPNGGRTHSRTNRRGMLGSKLRIASASPGRDERDFGSLGVESVQPPAAALKMQCGDQARAGIRDPWERYKIILNQRGQSVKIGTGKKEITTSGAFLKTTETPARSRDVDPRWRLCGELCQHVFGSLSQGSTPPLSESAQTAGSARPQRAPTKD
jgi:hypothetical protein